MGSSSSASSRETFHSPGARVSFLIHRNMEFSAALTKYLFGYGSRFLS